MFCWKSSSQPSSLIETTVIVSWCIRWVLRWTIQVVGTWLNWLSLYALHRSFARPELKVYSYICTKQLKNPSRQRRFNLQFLRNFFYRGNVFPYFSHGVNTTSYLFYNELSKYLGSFERWILCSPQCCCSRIGYGFNVILFNNIFSRITRMLRSVHFRCFDCWFIVF